MRYASRNDAMRGTRADALAIVHALQLGFNSRPGAHDRHLRFAHNRAQREKEDVEKKEGPSCARTPFLHPVRDSNPCYQDENLAS